MLEPGVIVAGDFRIDDVVGDGGMGVVYKATQLSLDRTVALKLITAALSLDFAFRERFRQEGRVQARLEHPHIIDVYAAGESEYGLFLAMRLVHGPSLSDLVGKPALSIHRTVRLLSQIGSALDAAHDVGLVHRDIKPQNILIDERRDHSYLADFGVTKARGAAGLTQVGQRVGTLTYMAPEQFRGQPATELSDIYSFGAVVYECLVGTVPYPMPTEASLITAHLTEPVPRISAQRPELPNALDAIIEKAMAKDPDDRYSAASELMRDVARAAGITPAAAPTVASAPGTVVSPVVDVEAAPSHGETILSDVPEAKDVTVATPPPLESPQTLSPAADATRFASAPAETTVTPAGDGDGAAAVDEPKPATEVTPPPPAAATELAPPSVAEPPPQKEPEVTPVPVGVTPATAAAPRAPAAASPAPPTSAAVAEPRVAPRERPSRAAVGGRRAVVGIAAVVIVLAIAGFFVGRANGPSSSKTVTTASHHSVSSGDISLHAPTSWTKPASAPSIPGLRLTNALALAPSANGAAGGLVAGHTPSAWPSFLPSTFRTAVGTSAVRNSQIVKLGDLDALRYRNLKPRGFDHVVTAYAVPQQKAATVIACYGSAAVLSACDRVAASLKLANAKPYPLDPSPRYAAAVNSAMRGLNNARRKGLAALAAASTQAKQASAASAIQAAYGAAARRLRATRTSAYIQPANTRIVAALRRTQSAYGRLAAAARAGDRSGYDAARKLIRSDEAAVRAELHALRKLGFTL